MENTETVKTTSNAWMKRFIPIWSAQLFSLLGSSLVQFALVWYLTQKTGSVVILTTATLMAVLPDVILGPFAGVLVDRWNRRIVMIVADASTAFFTLILAVLFALGKVEVWHIFVVLFLRETGGIFQWPAMSTSTSLMVPEEHLSRVAGINQAIRGGLNIVAAPLGALLMSVLAFYQVISIDIITAIIAITPLFFIRIPQPIRNTEGEKVNVKEMFKDMAEGFKFMKSWPGILMLAVIAAFINFVLAPSGTLMPLIVTQYFKKGVWELSLLDSSMGIGIVVGGLLLGVWGGFKNKVVTSMMGVVGIGVSIALLGLAPANLFYLALIGSALCGFMNPMANGPLQAILQSKVPPEMQGRVMGFTGSICAVMMPLGLLLSAPFVKAFGLQTWYWASGLITILLGLSACLIRPVMALEKAKITVDGAAIAVS